MSDKYDEQAERLLLCWYKPAANCLQAPECWACQKRPAVAAALRETALCGVCGGVPPVSGLPCICGGSGRAIDEAQHAREIIFDLNKEIADLRAEVEELTVRNHQIWKALSPEKRHELNLKWLTDWHESKR